MLLYKLANQFKSAAKEMLGLTPMPSSDKYNYQYKQLMAIAEVVARELEVILHKDGRFFKIIDGDCQWVKITFFRVILERFDIDVNYSSLATAVSTDYKTHIVNRLEQVANIYAVKIFSDLFGITDLKVLKYMDDRSVIRFLDQGEKSNELLFFKAQRLLRYFSLNRTDMSIEVDNYYLPRPRGQLNALDYSNAFDVIFVKYHNAVAQLLE